MNNNSVAKTQAMIHRIDEDIASQHGRMVELALIAGNISHAQSLIDRAVGEQTTRNQKVIDGSTPIADVLQNLKISNALESVGIEFISDLTNVTATHIISTCQMRGRSIEIIRERILPHGFDLKPESIVSHDSSA